MTRRNSSTVVSLLIAGLMLGAAGCGPGEWFGDGNGNIDRSERDVIYGEDDRADYYAHPNEDYRRLARESIVALISTWDLDESDPDDVRVTASSLQDRYNLCPDQRFLDQPTAAFCSGTLIDDDLVLTAGHCIRNDSECQRARFVFNYYYEAEGQLAHIGRDDVYECDRVIDSFHVSSGADYAVVKLNRPVVGHVPAPVKVADEALEVGDPLLMIGCGSGIPFKIDDGGHVTNPRATTLDYFVGTVDAFGGNSGSGVFDEDLNLVGILVRGAPDYVWDGSCRVVNELPEEGSRGEDMTYVARAIDALCDSDYPSRRLCVGRGSWCSVCEDDVDCLEDWVCGEWPYSSGERICRPPCDNNEDCQDGHSCGLDGLCEPQVFAHCQDGDVWESDACGLSLGMLDQCAEDEWCSVSECVERGAGDTCAVAEEIEAVTQTITGDMRAGYTNQYEGSCAGRGPEIVYTFHLDEPAYLDAMVSGFDTVMYLRGECEDPSTEIACNDDATPPGSLGSRIEASLGAGTYYLFVDSYDDRVNTYTLEIELETLVVPEGDTCATAEEIMPVTQTLTGELTRAYTGSHEGSCGGRGREKIYTFHLDEPVFLDAMVSGFDTVMYLRGDCENPDTEIACNDDATPPGGLGSRVEATLEPGTYYLFIDSFGEETLGTYTLDILVDAFGELEGDTCATAQELMPVTQALTGELTRAYTGSHEGSCGGSGREKIYTFHLDEPANLDAMVSGFDTVMYLRGDCKDPDSEIACNDDATPPGELGSRIEATLEAGTYYLFIDSYDGAIIGNYGLDIEFTPLSADGDDGIEDEEDCSVEIIDEPLRDGMIPTGWEATEMTWVTAAGGYVRFPDREFSELRTPVLDLSEYSKVKLEFSVSKWGSGENGPITVQVSTDGGLTWTAQEFDSPVPEDSSEYLSSGSTSIAALGDQVVIRFVRHNSPSDKRLRDVSLIGFY